MYPSVSINLVLDLPCAHCTPYRTFLVTGLFEIILGLYFFNLFHIHRYLKDMKYNARKELSSFFFYFKSQISNTLNCKSSNSDSIDEKRLKHTA